MTPPTPDQFAEFYEAVHGNPPFPWQRRLADRVCGREPWPRAIALPTAAGKTACIDVAVFALACGAKGAARRIFFVVDRRIVVDQAHRHADKLGCVLDRADEGVLRAVADNLRDRAQPGWLAMSAADRLRILRKRWEILDEKEPKERQRLLKKLSDDECEWWDVRPLDVYALRGGMYRETAWARSPLQPAVIASTVDQVGSRLLFRGYGVSDSMKPVHAALVGNDALILLDEAHCAKPFEQTARAVENYRGWNDSPAPFRFVSVTATPTGDGEVMRDDDDDRGHPVLGKRIAASKPAKLVVADKAKGKKFTAELVKELAKWSKELAVEGGCVGVIVNRVRTARELKSVLGEEAVLLTGRMRPLDRDQLFDTRLRPLLSNAKTDQKPPKFVIGTQCLEVGADFDFHALVTECASLDALRQRFGRLNRVANRDSAKAVVLIRGDQTDDTSEDPIYGASLGETWKWLISKGTDSVFDFGVAAVRAATENVDLIPLNAPAPDAPVLFPTHLDCWVQTHPIPTPDPDVSVFLHGPKQAGQPDVQVVFRADLGSDPKKWSEVVSLCPPSSSEAVAVPIGLFKKWLAGESADDAGGDVEGSEPPEAAEPEEAGPRVALCWMGAESDDTAPVSAPSAVRPTRTYVVPCSADEVGSLGDFITTPPADYAEEAFQRSRDKIVLRLSGLVLSEELSDQEAEELVNAGIEQRLKPDSPEWEQRAVKELTDPKKRSVEKHPVDGLVVIGKRRLHQFDPEFLDDGNSSYSPGRAVSLEDHSRGVAEYAVRFAEPLGLDAETYRRAGFFHDLGKLDPRFQAMLKQSSPRTAVGVPLAKSAKGPRSKAERDAAREVHRYPAGGRHELLSDALLATVTSDDLFGHLVATHHGSARPFADPVDENDAVRAPFAGELFGVKFNVASSKQDIAAWNGVLPERFWRVVRKYGWWGSAFREGVFRLADHAQSRAEQEKDWAPTDVPGDVKPPPLAPYAEPQRWHPLPLPGLDGANPLAFLAAVGTLRLADKAFPGTRLRWQLAGVWHPILELPGPLTGESLVQHLHTFTHRTADPTAAAGVKGLEKEHQRRKKAMEKATDAIKKRKLRGKDRELAVAEEVTPLEREVQTARTEWLAALDAAVPAPFLSLGKSIAVPKEEFARFAVRSAERLHRDGLGERADADFCPAFGCEVSTDQYGRITPTQFQLITGSGHQFFLDTLASLMREVGVEHLHRALFGPWEYSDPRLSFRWDPLDDRRYAVSWDDPSSTEVRTEHGANLLAAFALPLFPVVPYEGGAETTGFSHTNREWHFSWPVWKTACGVDVVRSLFALEHLHNSETDRVKLSAVGVSSVFRTRKFEVGRPPLSKWNLCPAITV